MALIPFRFPSIHCLLTSIVYDKILKKSIFALLLIKKIRILCFEYLIKEGFNANIMDTLKLLTHTDDTPYMEYVANIKTNLLAKKVKLAD